jgi:hypothetical protein
MTEDDDSDQDGNTHSNHNSSLCLSPLDGLWLHTPSGSPASSHSLPPPALDSQRLLPLSWQPWIWTFKCSARLIAHMIMSFEFGRATSFRWVSWRRTHISSKDFCLMEWAPISLESWLHHVPRHRVLAVVAWDQLVARAHYTMISMVITFCHTWFFLPLDQITSKLFIVMLPIHTIFYTNCCYSFLSATYIIVSLDIPCPGDKHSHMQYLIPAAVWLCDTYSPPAYIYGPIHSSRTSKLPLATSC